MKEPCRVYLMFWGYLLLVVGIQNKWSKHFFIHLHLFLFLSMKHAVILLMLIVLKPLIEQLLFHLHIILI